MRITKPQDSVFRRILPIKTHLHQWRLIVLALCVLSVSSIVVIGSVWYGVRLQISGQANAYFEQLQNAKHAIGHPRQTLYNYWQSWQVVPAQLSFDFKMKDWQILATKQQEAVISGSLNEKDNPWIEGNAIYNNQTIPVKVKLKGGPEHWNSDKWSFRVEVQNEQDTIFNIKTFSLQHPRTRFYLDEWVFHQLLAKEGLVPLKFDFINISINGKDFGIYALEQHFDKLVLEGNGRREGPILSISEDLYEMSYWPNAVWRNEVREPIPYQTSRILANDTLLQQAMAGRSLFELFRRQELSVCEVFDCPILAKYYALLEISGAQHAAGSGNTKFYYNPVTAHLEPLGYDAEIKFDERTPLTSSWSSYDELPANINWFRQIFGDDEFMKLYIANLEHFSDHAYFDQFWQDIEQELRQKIAILHRSYPTYSFDQLRYRRQQDLIKEILSTRPAINAYFKKVENNRLIIEAGTIMPVPVELKAIIYNNQEYSIFSPQTVVLRPTQINGSVPHQTITAQLPSGFDEKNIDTLELKYSVLGSKQEQNNPVSPLPREMEEFLENDLLREPSNYQQFSFIKEDKDRRILVVKAGKWRIDEPLVLPSGYTFIIEPGATLDLVNYSQILSYGPVNWIGSPTDKVKIISSDGTGRGVAVINTEEQKSTLTNVDFIGLGLPSAGPWSLTGSLTFYQSPVDIDAVTMQNNRDADDMLNLIRSSFNIRGSNFKSAFGDAIDFDFSDGIIEQTQISSSRNDAFDFSGSKVVLRNVTMVDSGDKGISAGEDSHIQAFDIDVRGGVIGLASKDKSELTATRGTITGAQVGLAVYQKKPEFGPAKLILNEVALSSVKDYLVEQGSQLIIGQQEINGQAKEVNVQVEDLVSRYAQQNNSQHNLLNNQN